MALCIPCPHALAPFAYNLLRVNTSFSYGADIPEAEYTYAAKLMDECHELINLGKTMDLRLVKVKDRFREVTKSDVQEFKARVKELQKNFDVEGPSNSSFSLEEAYQLFLKFQEEMEKATARQADLVNAEQLFNLDFFKVVGYPELTEVGAQMEKLAKIFDLYRGYVDFTESQSSMLWVDLDVSILQQGIVDLEKRCRKLPKILKEIATYRNLEAAIVAFKESIPLIGSLKNDALKPRHWEKIMDATKIKFTMNPKTFTVGKLFAMKLNRFTDEINDLVNEAMQEAKIEAQLRCVDLCVCLYLPTYPRTYISICIRPSVHPSIYASMYLYEVEWRLKDTNLTASSRKSGVTRNLSIFGGSGRLERSISCDPLLILHRSSRTTC